MTTKHPKLLTSNAKLEKSGKNWSIVGLSLAPHKQSGRNTCPEAGHCADMCVLWFAGRTVMPTTRNAMIARTNWFFEDRKSFLAQLKKELRAHVKRCKRDGTMPAVRLNVASDLPWERIAPELFEEFSNVHFYDYTKVFSRAARCSGGIAWPDNYELTYSFNERSNVAAVEKLMENGLNVAIVTDAKYTSREKGKLPRSFRMNYRRWPTVDGDKHDVRLRAVDGRGRAILLRSKGGKAKALEGVRAGFVQPVPGGLSS